MSNYNPSEAEAEAIRLRNIRQEIRMLPQKTKLEKAIKQCYDFTVIRMQEIEKEHFKQVKIKYDE